MTQIFRENISASLFIVPWEYYFPTYLSLNRQKKYGSPDPVFPTNNRCSFNLYLPQFSGS